MQVDCVFVLAEGVGQKYREKDSEECWGEHTALLGSSVDGEWVWCCTIVDYCATHVSVEWLDDGVQLWGAADLLQELVESTSVDKVKRLRQVYEGKEERVI